MRRANSTRKVESGRPERRLLYHPDNQPGNSEVGRWSYTPRGQPPGSEAERKAGDDVSQGVDSTVFTKMGVCGGGGG